MNFARKKSKESKVKGWGCLMVIRHYERREKSPDITLFVIAGYDPKAHVIKWVFSPCFEIRDSCNLHIS